jgi:single-strand DNA-binding protein
MPNGKAVANLRMATSEFYRDRESGERKDITDWHNIVCFEKTAEIVKSYVHKGSKILVEGKLKTRKWKDKEGNDRYTTEVRVDRLELVSSKQQSDTHKQRDMQEDFDEDEAPPKKTTAKQKPAVTEDPDDDIPF